MSEIKVNQDIAPEMITIEGREYRLYQAGQKGGMAQALRECSDNVRRAEDFYGAQFKQLADLLKPHVQNMPEDNPTKMAVDQMEATVRAGFRAITTQFRQAADAAQVDGSQLLSDAVGMARPTARPRARGPAIVRELLYISAVSLFWTAILFAVLT